MRAVRGVALYTCIREVGVGMLVSGGGEAFETAAAGVVGAAGDADAISYFIHVPI